MAEVQELITERDRKKEFRIEEKGEAEDFHCFMMA